MRSNSSRNSAQVERPFFNKNPLSPEDTSKLHTEINQYINQKLTITSTAITLFGVVMGWVVFGLSFTSSTLTLQPVSLLLPTALILVLDIMLWQIDTIQKQIGILSVYLEISGSSRWERDYKSFVLKRRSKEAFHTHYDVLLLIFAVIGGLSFLIPVALLRLFPVKSDFNLGWIVAVFVATIFVSIGIWCYCWIQNKKYYVYRTMLEGAWAIVLQESQPLREQRPDR